MKYSYGRITTYTISEVLEQILNQKLVFSFPYSEYQEINIENQLKQFKRHLAELLQTDSYYVFVEDDKGLKGCILMSVSEFDTSIFGFKVAAVYNILAENINNEAMLCIIDGLLKCARANNIRYLTLSINANDKNSVSVLNAYVKGNFYLINTLVTFGFKKSTFQELDLSYKCADGVDVRLVRESDFEELLKIAQESYQIDRYHLDKNLPAEKCDLLFTKSLENSIFNKFVDVVFVAEYLGKACGYYSFKSSFYNELSLSIGSGIVSAVSVHVRRKGLFQAMNFHGLNWLHENSDISELGTYINNYPVLSVFTKNRLNLVRGTYQLAAFLPDRI